MATQYGGGGGMGAQSSGVYENTPSSGGTAARYTYTNGATTYTPLPADVMSFDAAMAQILSQQQIAAQNAATQQAIAAMQSQTSADQMASNEAMQRTGVRSSMMGEMNRYMALGETATTMEKLQGLIKQGGLLSQAQIAEQARRETGQVEQGIASQAGQLEQDLAQSGITNPAAVAAASAGLKSGQLGAGAKAQSQGEWANAQSLAGILSQSAQLGQSRAAIQATPSYEQWQDREYGTALDAEQRLVNSAQSELDRYTQYGPPKILIPENESRKAKESRKKDQKRFEAGYWSNVRRLQQAVNAARSRYDEVAAQPGSDDYRSPYSYNPYNPYGQ